MSYDLDGSTSLTESSIIGNSKIFSISSVEGSGINGIAKVASNSQSVVSSNIISQGDLSSTISTYASDDLVSLIQDVQAVGRSETAVSCNSGSTYAAQNAGVLYGTVRSFQAASAQSGMANAVQASSISGVLGYSNGEARSSSNTVKLTGGLNGIGGVSGVITATTSEGAEASGFIQADSLESKAYSAIMSTSAEGDAYSYLSSADQLASSLGGRANSFVTSIQNLNSNGDVRIYAASTLDDSSSKSFDASGEAVSGSISAFAGSSSAIETNLEGDLQSTTAGLIPTPGSWVWNGFGGYLASNPYQIQEVDGTRHIFAKGEDNGLWDNAGGDWQGLGGQITSDPYAINDEEGNIHIFVKGSDNALWQNVLGIGWSYLGGSITSNPCAALSPDDRLVAVVKGEDNSIWLKDLTIGEWSPLGGVIQSNPQAIYDANGKLHVLVKGSDGALWDNVDGAWQGLGGSITSDANPVLNPFNDGFVYTFVRGEDGALWCNALDITSYTATWTGLGGFISPASGSIINGNPSPVVDTDGLIHTFVRGGDGSLWDNVNGNWYSMSGFIESDPNAIRDMYGRLHVAAVGGDNGLWVNTIGLDQTPTTLVGKVACDFELIQDAVDAMDDGSVIKVLSGTFLENVMIDKSLTLEGAGSDSTIVDGNQAGSVLTIGMNNAEAQVALSGMTIQGGSGTDGYHHGIAYLVGGGIVNFGQLALANCVISNNIAGTSTTEGYGGGIYNGGYFVDDVWIPAILDITSCTISENAAHHAGGIDNDGIITIIDCIISGNIASSSTNFGGGGGIINWNTMNIFSSTISDNTAALNGGGIVNSGTIDVQYSTISDNAAALNGGGIANSGIMVMQYSTISDNIATLSGGGIANRGTIDVQYSTISGNAAGTEENAMSGGGIQSSGTATISNSEIFGNTATWDGGGLHNWEGTMTVTDSNIYENTANENGGGVYNGGFDSESPGSTTLNGCMITGNTAGNLGGGVANFQEGSTTVNDCTIETNMANKGGGLANWDGGALTIDSSTVHDNNGTLGGGVYNSAQEGSSTPIYTKLAIQNSIVNLNTAIVDGGGIYWVGTVPIIIGSTISSNTPNDTVPPLI